MRDEATLIDLVGEVDMFAHCGYRGLTSEENGRTVKLFSAWPNVIIATVTGTITIIHTYVQLLAVYSTASSQTHLLRLSKYRSAFQSPPSLRTKLARAPPQLSLLESTTYSPAQSS
jgi:hypothetical protein